MRRLGLMLVGLMLSAGAPLAQPQDARSLVADGHALLLESRLADAARLFDAALPLAHAAGDRQAEGDALRGRGNVLYQQGKWKDAGAPLAAARAIYVELGDRRGEALVLDLLGSTGGMIRDPDADRYYARAEQLFADLGDRVQQARVMRNRTHLPQLALDRKLDLLARAFPLAGEDPRLQGLILHSWGSLLLVQSQYSEAVARLEQAGPLLEQAGSPRERARLRMSLGSAYHVHGQPAKASEVLLDALRRFEAIGDDAGLSQTAGYLAESYGALDQPRRALEMRERSLAHARKTGSAGLVAGAVATLGQAYLQLGEYERATALMEEALDRDQFSETTVGFYRHLARAYSALGRHDDAIRTATRGVDLARKHGRTQFEMGSLHVRATAHRRAGDLASALADARAGLDALERLRAKLAPNDYLKSGFANDFQALFALTIDLLHDAGRTSEAAVVAEQARARAFLDLLAARDAQPDAVPVPAAGTTVLTMRSGVSAPIPTMATLQGAAAASDSTIVSFWVGDEATFVWVVSPSGQIASHRAALSKRRLTRLVRQTWSLAGSSLSARGLDAGVDDEAALPAEPAAEDPALAALTLRGGDPIRATGRELAAYDALYAALIAPVRHALPREADRLLTIVPHGPLFELSFAALRDSRGRHLLEDYRLHYVPSAASLEFTLRRSSSGDEAGEGYLFVANPRTAGSVAATPLPSLPGAEREVQAIARLLRGQPLTRLSGPSATEGAIRRQAGRYRVVHFATHGIVSSERPFESFLALAGGGAAGADDGRLTAAEIYELELNADLVVLSACRAAGGQIAGDGIVGLTRAFFAAGAPSILAALWDLADESAEHLLPRFYAEWRKTGDKSRALRSAQLSMLRDLRAGRLTVDTPLGPLALPPHPVLWANLVLLGDAD